MSNTMPASAPGSPKIKRAVSINEKSLGSLGFPATPQRVGFGGRGLRCVTSPFTPKTANSSAVSSPFTPLTNTLTSSTYPTPTSSVSSVTKINSSPEYTKFKSPQSTEITNWRLRAKENGIRVGTLENGENENILVDPKGDRFEVYDTVMNAYRPSSFHATSTDPTDIPASFYSTHRRPRQAQFQTRSSDITAYISPKAARVPMETENAFTPSPFRNPLSNLNTPSPQSSQAIVEKMKIRGSLTDPAKPRRRPTFGASTGDALFDIEEDCNAYKPFLQGFRSPLAVYPSRLRCVTEPLPVHDTLDEPVPSNENLHQNFLSKLRSARSNESLSDMVDSAAKLTLEEEKPEKACSVCSSATSPLSSLVPCGHLICSFCLTGALNIVGEKDMCCTICESVVTDFKLLARVEFANDSTNTLDASADVITLLPSMFDEFKKPDHRRAATNSTTDSFSHNHSSVHSSPSLPVTSNKETAVLRIDNVPWDITPPALAHFFAPFETIRAHVLLDSRGKTLSHAYVEVAASDAKKALRSVQNKTMGKGRRMRGVTVTMSSDAELMRALFPSWKGTFDGAKPSLMGLDNDMIVKALEHGLVSLQHLDSLITLMRNPESHFLKVPSLPFYSLVSILSKFPSDIDSRVFWNFTLRDLIFETTYGALETLLSRVDTAKHDQHLIDQLKGVGIACRAFTDQQRLRLIALANTSSPNGDNVIQPQGVAALSPVPTEICTPEGSMSEHEPTIYTHQVIQHTQGHALPAPITPYHVLAREFGVQPDLVQALAQRMSVVGFEQYPNFAN